MRRRSGYKLTGRYCQARPYRRQASSHRYSTGSGHCGDPVKAGLPAIGPVQATLFSAQYAHTPG
ncbi:hypothetical protein E8E78_03720 [Pseudomonas sp. BN505]|nr:hypothetical protein [Pseudomonas sp. BN605]MDH4855718.1 hypothetical protein [Pseudomonas sp. BN505]NTY91840.1 hypothetical protein [Pseudomonas putida]NTZ00090.1 hypothetical protein [Pseudomonas putida]NTZ22355.1 hypothetical protein [Pseudomonas putida]